MEIGPAGGDGLRECDRCAEPLDGKVAVGGAGGNMIVPAAAADLIEQDAREAMVVSDGPAALGGERWEGGADEVEPAGFEGGAGGMHRRESKMGTAGQGS